MAKVVNCPHCGQKLALPEGWEGKRLQCPLCQTQFPATQLAEIVETVADDDLPDQCMVIVAEDSQGDFEETTDKPEQHGTGPAAVAASEQFCESVEEAVQQAEERPEGGQDTASAEELSEQEEAPGEPDLEPASAEASAEHEEAVEEQAAKAEREEDIEAETSVAECAERSLLEQLCELQICCPACNEKFSLGELKLSDEASTLQEKLSKLLAPTSAPTASEVPSEAQTWDFIPGADEERSVTDRLVQQQKPVNVLKELISWVLGGLAGLVLAYYLLVIIKGEQGNFLKIPVPGIPHTYKYSPEWFPNWLKQPPEAEEETEAPAEEQSEGGTGPVALQWAEDRTNTAESAQSA